MFEDCDTCNGVQHGITSVFIVGSESGFPVLRCLNRRHWQWQSKHVATGQAMALFWWVWRPWWWVTSLQGLFMSTQIIIHPLPLPSLLLVQDSHRGKLTIVKNRHFSPGHRLLLTLHHANTVFQRIADNDAVKLTDIRSREFFAVTFCLQCVFLCGSVCQSLWWLRQKNMFNCLSFFLHAIEN